MQYKVEDIIQHRPYLQELGEQCWNEVDQLNGDFPFDPDWEQYELLNAHGMIRYYTAYSDEGTFEGFAIFLINKSLHCKTKYSAFSDCVYISKKYRGHGAEFIKLIQDDLREEGVSIFSLHIKSWLDSGKLGEAIDCELYEYVYQKRL